MARFQTAEEVVNFVEGVLESPKTSTKDQIKTLDKIQEAISSYKLYRTVNEGKQQING